MRSGRASIGCVTSVLKKFVPKAVMRSGAVSPATRAMASTTPVMMPLMLAGSTTRRIVRASVAPSASEASRSSLGTKRRTSSDVVATMGIMMMPSATPPASPEKDCWGTTIKTQANRPKMIVGIPVSTATRKRTPLARTPLPNSER